MRIAIIGTGQVGTTLGRAWANVGHEVVFGSRGSTSPVVGSSVDTPAAAAAWADVVVLTIPWAAASQVVPALGDLQGKVLIDVTNPIGPGFVLTHGHDGSGAEQVAALATNARVVKAFNSTGLENMANPQYGPHRIFMPVAGDDGDAVSKVVQLAEQIGFDAYGFDSLRRARETEPLAMLWIKLALAWGNGRNIGFAVSRRLERDAPSSARPSKRQRIAIVGSGNIGGALARAWLRTGHDVRIVTRDANATGVKALVALGATTSGIAQGADQRDVIVLAIPAGAVVEVAQAMGGLEGQVVVDCTNAIGKGFTLTYGHTTSSSEQLAKALPGARIVRSFNQQGAEVLVNPVFAGTRATNFVAADDDDARNSVLELAADVGLDAVPAGPLASARYLEPMTVLWVSLSKAIGTRQFGWSLVRR
ncbi:MAG: NAD(P)-binding domain-containing protein [Polyangiaceae bacterium]|nr:NAD(P)-binding domain-containing protein [Myxococcales bacterium]MCB9588264.1 NAD(P)-binding domain-containing protein [Polyangiaceae bacterium]